MFPTRYFPDRYFAPRYFPKLGSDVVIGLTTISRRVVMHDPTNRVNLVDPTERVLFIAEHIDRVEI